MSINKQDKSNPSQNKENPFEFPSTLDPIMKKKKKKLAWELGKSERKTKRLNRSNMGSDEQAMNCNYWQDKKEECGIECRWMAAQNFSPFVGCSAVVLLAGSPFAHRRLTDHQSSPLIFFPFFFFFSFFFSLSNI